MRRVIQRTVPDRMNETLDRERRIRRDFRRVYRNDIQVLKIYQIVDRLRLAKPLPSLLAGAAPTPRDRQ